MRGRAQKLTSGAPDDARLAVRFTESRCIRQSGRTISVQAQPRHTLSQLLPPPVLEGNAQRAMMLAECLVFGLLLLEDQDTGGPVLRPAQFVFHAQELTPLFPGEDVFPCQRGALQR